MIRIFTDKKEKELKNFWNHIVFHPTNAIEDDWGREQLDKIAADKAARTVRIYSMFEESVTLDENGEMKFDFSKNDFRIDYLLSKGFDIFISYAFFPEWLAKNKSEEFLKPRYKGASVSVSVPGDYSKWEEICRVYTKHLIDRYGEDVVSKWHLNCYNEPDSRHFFGKDSADCAGRAKEYCKLYDAFEAGVTSVSRKLRIGGCALSQSPVHFDFLELFLKHIKESGRKFDFLSFHSYGTGPNLMNKRLKLPDVRGAAENSLMVKRIADMSGFKDIPLVCDEWGTATAGYTGSDFCPAFEFRENEMYSAYFIKMIAFFEELNFPQDMMMLCLSGQHDLPGDFMGHRNFFSKSFYPKPIYNAHVLANKLGEEKLYFTCDPFGEIHVSVIPTLHKDGHMSILLAYADPAFVCDLPPAEFQIKLEGIKCCYDVRKYVIDKNHANAYTKFCELGCPQSPEEKVKEEIRKAGELCAEDCGTVSPENPDIKIGMEKYSVVLLELFPAL